MPIVHLIAAAIAAFIILAQGISAPFQKDAEPQSAEWIVSVTRDGNWLTPRDYYGFFDRKPPLYYWLSAIVTKASGGTVDETRARLVSVVSATVIAVEVLAWTGAEVGLATGWLAFLFLLGIYGFSSRATLALTDMLMVAMLMSAWLLAYPMFSGPVPRWRVLAAGTLLGLGIMTKGPLVLILIALAAFLFAILSGSSLRAFLGRMWPWQILALSVAICAGWYLLLFGVEGSHAFVIFFKENLGHFAPEGLGGTGEGSRPFWYIVARLIGGANPLILLMPATLAAFATGEIPVSRRAPLLFQASLVAAVVIFFSIASAKRDDYILPALPGIAILSAAAFGLQDPQSAYPGGAKIRDGVSALIAFATILAGVLALITARRNPGLSFQSSDAALMTLLERGIGTRDAPFMLVLAIWSMAAPAALFFLYRRSIVLAGAMIGIIALAGVTLVDTVVRPELAWARSCKIFLADIGAQIDSHPLFVVHNADFELAFYYGRGLPPLIHGVHVPPIFGNQPPPPPTDQPSYLLAHDSDLGILPDTYRKRMRRLARTNGIGRDGGMSLYLLEPPQAGLNSGSGTAR